MDEDFKYDVAFSFLAQDEGLATHLNELLEPRLSTFLYSKRQEELAGTDGESSFNDVFAKQARIVVILYRPTWGTSPWTRIEETAIRNRAHGEGYDFTIFVPLDLSAPPPKWLPKNRLWVGLERWGVEGAAGVIEARVQDQGGSPKEETFDEYAARQTNDEAFARRRGQKLSSQEGAQAFSSEVAKVQSELGICVEKLNALRSAATFQFAQPNPGGPIFMMGERYGLSVTGQRYYANTLDGARLEIQMWDGPPPIPGTFRFEPPKKLRKLEVKLDYLRDGIFAFEAGPFKRQHLSATELAEAIMRWYLERR